MITLYVLLVFIFLFNVAGLTLVYFELRAVRDDVQMVAATLVHLELETEPDPPGDGIPRPHPFFSYRTADVVDIRHLHRGNVA